MNEAETRAEYVDPKLKESGWGEVEGSKVLREFRITDGRIQVGGSRSKPEIADYILVYKGKKIAVIEAKKVGLSPTEGAAQAKAYAAKLQIEYTYSTNGKEIHEISMKSGKEGLVDAFSTPDVLILYSTVCYSTDQQRSKTVYTFHCTIDINPTLCR